MNAGATAERVHDAVRRMIQTRTVRPGARLDPGALADTLATSATPVREALNMLCGEGLVDARPGGGFHVRMIDAPALSDLYTWNEEVLGVVLRSAERPTARADITIVKASGDIATAIADLTEWLARASRNQEHLRAIRDINARLHAARLVEPLLLVDTEEELARLVAAADVSDIAQLRAGWRLYHRRRHRVVANIVRSLLRD